MELTYNNCCMVQAGPGYCQSLTQWGFAYQDVYKQWQKNEQDPKKRGKTIWQYIQYIIELKRINEKFDNNRKRRDTI